jgi:hypothetical protein
MTVLMFVLQSDEPALTEISLSAGCTPVSNHYTTGADRARKLRH